MVTSSEYLFGLRKGHLPERADETARRHGAVLVNFTDAEDNCGHGCAPHTCPRSARHWFAAPNRCEPWNGQFARAVAEDLERAGFVQGR